MTNTFKQQIISYGKTLIEAELKEAQKLMQRISDDFVKAVDVILSIKGKVIVSGIGKSGLIGQKIAASLSSTGTPACFMHLSEALHGDLGVIQDDDAVILISYSGKAQELDYILPFLNKKSVPMIAMTGNTASKLASASIAILDISIEKEACPLALAPTASSTNALIMGDALTAALMQAREFNADDFALYHPSGNLGVLLLKVKDFMRKNAHVPKINLQSTVFDAMLELSRTGLGLVAVCNNQDEVEGVFTDGDLRRLLLNNGSLNSNIAPFMTQPGFKLNEDEKASNALRSFNKLNITAAPVINKDNKLTGAINIHDLHQAGVS